MLSTLIALCAYSALALALDNGQARTPRMGWNPYNAFSCDTNEAQYRAQTDALVSSGLAALGYSYMVTDCGWQSTQRGVDGSITWNTTRLPSGMGNLSSYVHAKGLKFGVYSNAGYFSCDNRNGQAGWVGSLNHEAQDAATFAAWGADYLKYDNCFSDSPTTFVNHDPSIDLRPHFIAMRDALAKVNRPVVYGLCEWGVQDPARWAAPVGNSWRMSDDISASWSSIVRIVNELVPVTGFAGPGAWNDMDLLEVGQSSLTTAEQQTHFAFWAAAKSPLIISTDLTKLPSASMAILNNTRVIALNQDALGKSIAFKRRYTDDHDVWAGPLADGSTAALLLNWQNTRRTVTLDLADVGLASASAHNVITGASLGTLSTSYTSTLDAHGVLVLKLSNALPAASPAFTWYPASTFVLAGGAALRTANASAVAGFIGLGGTATLSGIDGGAGGGTRLLAFDFINAEVDFLGADANGCPNCRDMLINVNGGTPATVNFPLSGMSWDIVQQGYLVRLGGFKAGKTNTLVLSNPAMYAPDILRVGDAA